MVELRNELFKGEDDKPAKSWFANSLRRLMDETNLFSRDEWATVVGISTDEIAQWLDDKAIPRPEHLFVIFDAVKTSDATKTRLEHFADFGRMSELSADHVSPLGSQMMPTVWAYMNQPTFKK